MYWSVFLYLSDAFFRDLFCYRNKGSYDSSYNGTAIHPGTCNRKAASRGMWQQHTAWQGGNTWPSSSGEKLCPFGDLWRSLYFGRCGLVWHTPSPSQHAQQISTNAGHMRATSPHLGSGNLTSTVGSRLARPFPGHWWWIEWLGDQGKLLKGTLGFTCEGVICEIPWVHWVGDIHGLEQNKD